MSTSPKKSAVKATVTIKLFDDDDGGLGGLVEVDQGDLPEHIVLEKSMSALCQYLNRHIAHQFAQSQE